jgi:hypothetical protein
MNILKAYFKRKVEYEYAKHEFKKLEINNEITKRNN